MAVYKVIQDIEADDKLLGPLSLKQFIFAIIVVGLGFFGFLLGRINPVLAFPMVPPMIVFGFLAAPLGREQPNEIWLAARVRFFLKPKKRIWDQTGIKELVTITAPKRIERSLTNNLSQGEVKSRLSALADTLDSRGWAVKTADVNSYSQPTYAAVDNSADRLIGTPSMPQPQPISDVNAGDDILDPLNNPIAQHFDQMIQTATQEHRQQAISQMQQVASGQAPAAGQQPPPNYWFMYQGQQQPAQPGYAAFDSGQVIAPQPMTYSDDAPLLHPTGTSATDEELELMRKAKAKTRQPTSHLKTILPLSEQAKQAKKPPQPAQPAPEDFGGFAEPQQGNQAPQDGANPAMTASPPPGILELANNDELSVATLAQQAKRVQGTDSKDGEVVISLH